MKNNNLLKISGIFFIFITFLVFSCFNSKENTEIKIPKNKLDEKFFKSSRILDEFKNIENLEKLKLISLEKSGNKTIRLLFNYPLFSREEIGKKYDTSFFYFDPVINGKYIVRTNRIIDYVLENKEEKNLTLIIPKNLTGIQGHKTLNEIKIEFFMNTKNTDEIFYFADSLKTEDNYTKLNQSDSKTSSGDSNINADKSNYDSTGYTDLKTVIDLEQNINNSFTYKNIYSIQRKYKKISKNDIENIIINYDSPQKIKEYFFKAKLPEFPRIKSGKDNKINTALFVPEKESGLFFCYQKVFYDKKNYKEFYQIYNFANSKIFILNTEISVLMNLLDYNGKKSSKLKTVIYNTDGNIISDGVFNDDNFYIFKNNNYRNIFVLLESDKLFLNYYRLKNIKKIDYNISANFTNLENNRIRINGIITGRKGEKINTKKINADLLISQNSIDISKYPVKNIQKSGLFHYEIPIEINRNYDFNITFFINNKKIKEYIINPGNNSEEFFKNPKNHAFNIVKLKQNAVFYNNPAKFMISNDYKDDIDSIAYNVFLNNDLIFDNLIDVKSKDFDVVLPEENGKYRIELEVLFKNGNEYTENYNVEKISDIKNKSIIIRNNYYKVNNDGITIDVYNPFKNPHTFIVDYNNNICLKQKIKLIPGFNKVSIPLKTDEYIFNRIIVIYDSENNSEVYIYNKINLLIDKTKNLNYTLKNNFLNIKSGKFKGNKLLIQYSPLVSSFTNPFIDSIYRYNDSFEMDSKPDKMFPGDLIDLDNIDELNLKGIDNRNYKLDIINIDEKSREYYNSKPIIKGQKIFVDFLGSENISLFDNPEYEIVIQNDSDKDMDLDLEIISSNGKPEINNKNIIVKKRKTDVVNFSISDFKKGIDSELKINIYSYDDLIYSNSKKLNLKHYDFIQSAQISGNIIDTRISEGYLKIPDDSFSDFEINLLFSSNKYLGYLKRNHFIDNIKVNIFEIELLRFLDNYLEIKYLDNELYTEKISKYYIPGKGFKKNISDSWIDLESTFLYLFIAKQLNVIYEPVKINSIIKYNINNNKSEILKSDFIIFVLGEYGYFFDEIDTEYIKNILNSKRSILYFKYYEKYKINYEYRNKINEYIFYNDYRLSEQFYDILKYYFGVSDLVFEESYYYPFLVEGIIAKSILLNKYELENNNSRIDFDFNSPLLGDFSEEIAENETVLKKYSFQFLDSESRKKKIIDYKIKKKSGNNLYYLISANYNAEIKNIIKNNNMEIYTEWIYADNILDKNSLNFLKDQQYQVNLYLINNFFERKIFLKPIECSGFKINFNSVVLNNKKCPLINNDNNIFIILNNLKPGVNVISYKITPVYFGDYHLNNMILFDIYDFKNCLSEGDCNINIIP